jgi:hypothetical protein
VIMWDLRWKSGNGAGLLQVLWFPLPIIPLTAPLSSSSGAGTIGQMVADIKWTRLTPPQEKVTRHTSVHQTVCESDCM